MWPRSGAEAGRDAADLPLLVDVRPGAGGSGRIRARRYDQRGQDVNAQVGGIEYLGELNKPHLYQAISDAAVMWYPGVSTFAETSCIAATEANACGTPFVGSLRGALWKRPSRRSRRVSPADQGDPERDEAYAGQHRCGVAQLLAGCRNNSFAYRTLSRRQGGSMRRRTTTTSWRPSGKRKSRRGSPSGTRRTRSACSGSCSTRTITPRQGARADIEDRTCFLRAAARLRSSRTNRRSALRKRGRLRFLRSRHRRQGSGRGGLRRPCPRRSAERSRALGSLQAGHAAVRGPLSVLDVACGNGSFAIALALRRIPPSMSTGWTTRKGNIERARDGAVRAGVADRVHLRARHGLRLRPARTACRVPVPGPTIAADRSMACSSGSSSSTSPTTAP
jgi:hypothetical protein